MCGRCHSFAWSWQPVSGEGRVVSHIRTHHSFLPDVEAPYTTVFVALAEQDDVVMPGFWRGDHEPVVGQLVTARIEGSLLGWA
jgi:hypothetical protein